MDIQELKNFVSECEFSQETKNKINQLLEGKTELDTETIESIKVLMQAELDREFSEDDADIANDPKVKEIEKAYEVELKNIESDLKNDMIFVDSELKELETIRKQVAKTSDDVAANAIRDSI